MTDLGKWALLVGIGDYPNIHKLRGTVNDAHLIAKLLQRDFGFPAEHTLLLLDAAATREGMLAAVERLGERVQDDDAVVFFYSGWGAQLPDPAGRWPGGLVSTLLPYDVGADGSGQVTYDELWERLLHSMAARPYLTLIIDTNHAGTVGPCLDTDPHLRERTVFLGACRAEENAYEAPLEGVFHGVFTYALSQALVDAGPDTTYRQVFEQVSSQVLARFPQHPQMEGEGDRPLFGAGRIESMRFVPVTGRSRYTAALGAGAAYGMTAGSQWAIYPPDTLQVTGDTPKLGLVEITKVGAVAAEARILSEAGAEAIAAGTKAIEETHNYGEMRLVVGVQVPDNDLRHQGEKLRKLFMDSELIRAARPDEEANVTAWLVPPRSTVGAGEPVPQLGTVDEAIWALIDESDRLLRPTYSVKDRSAVWELRDNLERLARNRNVLNLRNPNLNSPLMGKVDFSLERQLADGTWAEVRPEGKSGMVVLDEEDRIRFVIRNRHQAPLYVSILGFPWHGSFSLIFPTYRGTEKLAPMEMVETPELLLFTPDERSERAGAHDEPSAARVEIAKLFATAYPIDFGALTLQDGMRGVKSSMGEATVLWELLDMALTGYGSRRSRPVQLPPEQDWITIERSFAVRRREG